MLLQSKNTVLLEERPLLARGHTLRDADRRELPYDTETSIEDEDSVQEGVSAAVIGLISRCPKDRYADAAHRSHPSNIRLLHDIVIYRKLWRTSDSR